MSCSAIAEELTLGALLAFTPEYSVKIGCSLSPQTLLSPQPLQSEETTGTVKRWS